MVDSSLALIVLTAGRSTRMGEPKALLRFGKSTALELAVKNAAAAGVGRVVAVIGYQAETIRAAHSFTNVGIEFSWALNRAAESEQIDSLKVGLVALEREPIDAFFFLPVDHPLVTPADFAALLKAHRDHSGAERVFIPTYQGRRGHPVLCRSRMRETILELPPGRTARDALEAGGIVQVEVQNPGILEDMNTPQDYRRLREIYRRDLSSGPAPSSGRAGPAGAAPG